MCMEYNSRHYLWEAMPFGLATAPREWQRLMCPIKKRLRSQGYLVWVYLDDFLLIAETKSRAVAGCKAVLALLVGLGFTINYRKSLVIPAQFVIYLGFELDLAQGAIRVPQHKLTSSTADIRRLLSTDLPTVRRVASVLGKIRALASAVPQIRRRI